MLQFLVVELELQLLQTNVLQQQEGSMDVAGWQEALLVELLQREQLRVGLFFELRVFSVDHIVGLLLRVAHDGLLYLANLLEALLLLSLHLRDLV